MKDLAFEPNRTGSIPALRFSKKHLPSATFHRNYFSEIILENNFYKNKSSKFAEAMP